MLSYLVKRILLGLVSLIIFLFALFLVVELAVPGDVATPLRLGMTAEEVDEVREQIGVTQPLPVRFWDWLSAFVGGEFEINSFMTDEGDTVFRALPATLLVFVIGLAVAYLVGTWLGRATAWRGGVRSGVLTLGGVVAYTLFPPFVAFVLAWFFDHRISGWRSSLAEGVQLWIDAPFTRNEVMLRMVTVIAVVWLLMAMVRRVFFRLRRRAISGWILVPLSIGLVLLGWAIRGIWPWAIDTLLAAALPIIGFTVLSFGEFLLITQAGMGAAMGDDYVVTAFAKGVAPQRIRDVHVGRNASLVVMTRLAVSLPYLMTGLVIIETALAWPGVGSFMFRAIESQDLPAVMSGLAVVGILALLIRLFLDAASAWADPRIKDGLAEAVTG